MPGGRQGGDPRLRIRGGFPKSEKKNTARRARKLSRYRSGALTPGGGTTSTNLQNKYPHYVMRIAGEPKIGGVRKG